MATKKKLPLSHAAQTFVHVSTEELVFALVDRVGPIILDHDAASSVYMIAAIVDENSTDRQLRNGPEVEYQVSDGPPGDRASSHDFSKYSKAKTAFRQMVASRKKARTKVNIEDPFCTKCAKPLTFADCLRGRCSGCGATI